MKRGGPLRRKKPLQSKKRLRPGKWSVSEAAVAGRQDRVQRILDGEASDAWHRYVLVRANGCCECCGTKATYEDPLEAHHVTKQQHIRAYVRSLRLPKVEAHARQRALLWDRRNGMALLQSHHVAHTRQVRQVPQAALRAEHWAFAEELGLAHVLLRQYAA